MRARRPPADRGLSGPAEAAARAAAARALRLDAGERRAGGVVATPLELARAAVARIDALLTSELGVEGGLASERVVVIDPAVGTGIWLAAVLERTGGRTATPALLGIDTDPEALAAAGHALAAARHTLSLRRANTLELSEVVEDDGRVRVVLGNPPWAARSRSRGGALSDAWLDEFRRDQHGAPLGERRAGVLSDDYVRFFRWALEQARASAAGALVCFATNASFLDGPVHRGMRAALTRSFDRLEVLDLGGNTLLSRGDERDDNLFGVRVGAALTWAVRRPGGADPREAVASFGRVSGSRADKLRALEAGPRLVVHVPSAPWFRLRPGPASALDAGFSLADAFVLQREGVQTNRDAVATAHAPELLRARVHAIARGEVSLRPARHFDPVRVRAMLERALADGEPPIAKLAYRPLERRWFVALAPLCHRPRPELLAATARAPLCLLGVRKERGAAPYNLFAVSEEVADACFLSVRSSCRTRVFPSRRADGSENLSERVAGELGGRLGREVRGEELVLYALAILGSPRHRAAHDDALKLDYARLPWPRDVAHFARALEVGDAFRRALCGAAVPPAPLALRSDVSLRTRLDVGALAYDLAGGVVAHGGSPLLEVAPALLTLRVGHHPLVASALAARAKRAVPRLQDLVEVLARAAAFRRAEQLADALGALA